MSLLLRGAGLVIVLLALLSPPAGAAPADEAPAYWPFHRLERGDASCRALGVSGRRVTVVTLRDPQAWVAFWHRAHPNPGPDEQPPHIDFTTRMVVVVVGRPGTAGIHAQKMWTLPGEKLAVGVFNAIWPDVPMDPRHVPFEVLIARRSERRVGPFERPAAQALYRATLQALARLTLPELRAHDMSRERLSDLRKVYADRGTVLLSMIDALPPPRRDDPEEPYLHLLRASVLHTYLDRGDDARKEWRQVVLMWPGSVPAKMAKSRLSMLERRSRDEEVRKVLDEVRIGLAGEQTVTKGHAERWSDLAQQYEYLTSLAPLSLFMAARCYAEAARDPNDDDRVQNAMLQAASLYERHFDLDVASRLYWACVKRYPDAASVPVTLQRLGLIGWEQQRKNALQAFCRRFLHAWPKSRNAPLVRRMLAHPGR